MEFFIKLDIVKDGPLCIIKYCIFSLKIDFVLANRAAPDEMPQNVAFRLGLPFLQNFPVYKRLKNSSPKLSYILTS